MIKNDVRKLIKSWKSQYFYNLRTLLLLDVLLCSYASYGSRKLVPRLLPGAISVVRDTLCAGVGVGLSQLSRTLSSR